MSPQPHSSIDTSSPAGNSYHMCCSGIHRTRGVDEIPTRRLLIIVCTTIAEGSLRWTLGIVGDRSVYCPFLLCFHICPLTSPCLLPRLWHRSFYYSELIFLFPHLDEFIHRHELRTEGWTPSVETTVKNKSSSFHWRSGLSTTCTGSRYLSPPIVTDI